MPMPLQESRLAFLAYLRHECGLAGNSVDAYDRDLKRFLGWMEAARIGQLTDLDIGTLGGYVAYLGAEKLAPASIARHVASLKMFFRFQVLEGRLPASAAELLNRPSLWDRIPYVLTERQVAALLDAPAPSDRMMHRDRALLRLMYATGARASEVCGLRVADVQLEERFCRCRGKGNKERIVPFGQEAQDALNVYLGRMRPALVQGSSDCGHLFVTRVGRPLTRVDAWKLIKKYASRIGVADKVSPHTLRHSFATHMLAQGLDLRVIQELLGHSNIATTQHYTRVDASRLRRIHSQFHPRA